MFLGIFDIILFLVIALCLYAMYRAGRCKMFSLLFASYMMTFICLGLRFSLDFAITYLQKNAIVQGPLNFSYGFFAEILSQASVTIILVIFAGMAYTIAKRSPLRLYDYANESFEQFRLIVLLILTVSGFVFSLLIILIGPELLSYGSNISLLAGREDMVYLPLIVTYLPILYAIHALVGLLLLFFSPLSHQAQELSAPEQEEDFHDVDFGQI